MRASVTQAGYAEIATTDVAAWVRLGELIGCEIISLQDGAMGLRIDEERMSRIQIRPADHDGLICVGWETAGPTEFRGVFDRLEVAGGKPVMRPDLAKIRKVQELATFTDPDGMTGEIYWGISGALRKAFVSPHDVRFAAGASGFGHIAVSVNSIAATFGFYSETLGLRLSEILDVGRLSVAFLHANERHHSLGLAEMPPAGGTVNHMMIEVTELDHLGTIRERLFEAGHRIRRDLGRHAGDGVISIYVATPAPFDLEIGWGSFPITENWERDRYSRRAGSWGHRNPSDATGLGEG